MPKKRKAKLGAATVKACERHAHGLDFDVTSLATQLRTGACPLPTFVRAIQTAGALDECFRAAGHRFDIEDAPAIIRLNNVIDDFKTSCLRKKR